VKPKRTVGIGLAVAIALLTSACAAGQQASTANEQNTIDGVNADLGPIHIRGMVIDAPTLLYKKNDSASVKVVLVNTSQTKSDLLVSVTSPAITDWGSFSTVASADAVLAANSSRPQKSTGPLPLPTRQVLIPAGGRTSYGTPESKGGLVFLSFTRDIYPGTTIPVTLRFAQAGSITIAVPIALANSVNTTPIAPPSPLEG
jgi:copper(I)-binding protein